MSSREDTYARKDSAESFGVGETADEWGKEQDLGLAHVGAQEGPCHEEEEAELESEGE